MREAPEVDLATSQAMPSAALAFGLVVAARDLFEVPTRPTAFLAPAQVGEISLTSPVFSAGTWGPSPAAGRVGTIAAPEAEPALSGQGWLIFGAAAVAGVLLSRAATRTRVTAGCLREISASWTTPRLLSSRRCPSGCVFHIRLSSLPP